MLLFFLNLVLHYGLLQCVEFEKADIHGLLRAHNQTSSPNATPSVYQLGPITAKFAFFTPPTSIHEELPIETRRNQNSHKTESDLTEVLMKNLYFRHQPMPVTADDVNRDMIEKPKEILKNPYFRHQSWAVTGIDVKRKKKSKEKSSSYSSTEHGSSDKTADTEESEDRTVSSESETVDTGDSGEVTSSSDSKTQDSDESSQIKKSSKERHSKLQDSDESSQIKKASKDRHRSVRMNSVSDEEDSSYVALKIPGSKYALKYKSESSNSRSKEKVSSDDSPKSEPASTTRTTTTTRRPHTRSSNVPTTKSREETTSDKHRLKPNLLLGKQIVAYDDLEKITTSKKKEYYGDYHIVKKKKKKKPRKLKVKHELNLENDRDIFKKMRTPKRTTKRHRILRMHDISHLTKKQWYTDRMTVTQTQTQTTPAKIWITTTRRSPKPSPAVDYDWSIYGELNKKIQKQVRKLPTTTSTDRPTPSNHLRSPYSRNHLYKEMEERKEGYMIVFLIELTRILAAKTTAEVHDVVKHADQIIHRQSKQLPWMGHPLLDVTRKIARMLKVTDIYVIQEHIANTYTTLTQRHQKLPAVVNAVLEYAETMYDDDEGKLLFGTLTELVEFPNIAFTGYTMCNSLINAFLRPFRRLKDTTQLQELMDSVNLALKKLQPLRSQQKLPLRSGGGFGGEPDEKHAVHNKTSKNLPKTKREPHTRKPTTPQHLRMRKKKRRHRLSKKMLKKKRHMLRYQYWGTTPHPQRHHTHELRRVTLAVDQGWF